MEINWLSKDIFQGKLNCKVLKALRYYYCLNIQIIGTHDLGLCKERFEMDCGIFLCEINLNKLYLRFTASSVSEKTTKSCALTACMDDEKCLDKS